MPLWRLCSSHDYVSGASGLVASLGGGALGRHATRSVQAAGGAALGTLGVDGRPVPEDDLHAWVSDQPVGQRPGLTCREDIDHAVVFDAGHVMVSVTSRGRPVASRSRRRHGDSRRPGSPHCIPHGSW